MKTTFSPRTTKLFEIVASYNSLTGKFVKGERLTVNLVRYNTTRTHNGFFWRIEVENTSGHMVNSILKMALTRKTAIGWALGNFGHQRIA